MFYRFGSADRYVVEFDGDAWVVLTLVAWLDDLPIYSRTKASFSSIDGARSYIRHRHGLE